MKKYTEVTDQTVHGGSLLGKWGYWGTSDSTYTSHHLIFFSQMCYFTADLLFSFQLERHHHASIHGNHHISMQVSTPASHPPQVLESVTSPGSRWPSSPKEGAHRTVTSAGRRPWSSTLPVWSCGCRTSGSSGCSGPTAAEDRLLLLAALSGGLLIWEPPAAPGGQRGGAI